MKRYVCCVIDGVCCNNNWRLYIKIEDFAVKGLINPFVISLEKFCIIISINYWIINKFLYKLFKFTYLPLIYITNKIVS